MAETRDLLRIHYPAFADLRDKLGMATTYTASDGFVHWHVVLSTSSYSLDIGDDRADWAFDIKPAGRKNYTSITRVLHRLGLWVDPHVRPNAAELARVFEDNLDKVLKALESDVFWRSLGHRE